LNPTALLIRLIDAMALTESEIRAVFQHSEEPPTDAHIQALLLPENNTPCSELQLLQFLDGLILERRGPPSKPAAPPTSPPTLTPNLMLKKLRIALNMREPEMLQTFLAGGKPLDKGELTALFRKPGHKHFRPCTAATFDAFLTGVALKNAAKSPTHSD
jgi:uncharacterized protein YehS (DUF1456 family)